MRISANHIRASVHSGGTPRPSHGVLTPAAVLVPFVQTPDGLQILLTRRTDRVEHHKGQISFPGGTTDPEDTDAVATALREAEEEIGLLSSDVEVVGFCDGLETPTGFSITPVVGILAHMPRLNVNAEEVEEIFTVPVEFFLDPKNETIGEREWKGERRNVYSYVFQEHNIWGATAWVIRTFLRRVSEVAERSGGR